jgi:adenylyltransferase/sulfurtransferase
MLTTEEWSRYNRQLILPEIGTAGQEKLKQAKVLVIGAGGLGCPVLQYLVAAGVGHIGIADDDVVDATNLHRQVLYSMADLGRNKAETAAQKMALLNPFVQLQAIPVRLVQENIATVMEPYDIIIDGSDNFPTRYLVNDACVQTGKPLVFGSIFKFEGQVSVFNYKGGPTYRCLFPEPGNTPNCAEIGVLGVLPGIIGCYMANEVLKLICRIGEPLSGKLLVINTLDNTTQLLHFSRTVPLAPSVPAMPATQAQTTAAAGITNITADELSSLLREQTDTVFLLDVREEAEVERRSIPGAHHIPLGSLAQRVNELPAGKTIVVYCQSGKRSQLAAALLQTQLPQTTIVQLQGGIETWK